ncbi:polysaccharide pyruvyl transferase [Thermosipho melanesiensis]|uniref:Polysaccharide pyruvyl transferase n=2 Tax=Thermosipho melanesiensis TaxID=46541 RepID=A6LMK7_THEM4|nr:polysaccharide pyruvyl transferase family protein [Thermosipho melanesiensis]ABR31158.1 polysaccharide pyruvyl transferase [Thermosipho melanesiensis BI429]APT74248.1 polysaccharide pyruvyl transferase [Thermosipho melanesiensis]OOC36187.1 polysaccharide pyruvyl transferase [Thermosipho melanesiensis]OOC37005.1 polysaccharide pyruvyl transferase [Thermosipho melanesiensis]OOC37757.1 polysaccharide pyruvyl transferase [Thermosipho melanesiensis]
MKNKILLVGYYGFGNFGDELMRRSIKNFLKERNYEVYELLPKENLDARSYNRFNFFSVISAILKSDIVVCGGGGILQDKTSLKSFLYYYSIFKLSLILKKPVLFFGNSFGPLNYYVSRVLIKGLLRSGKLYVFARDPVSYKFSSCFNANTHLGTDPGILGLEDKVVTFEKKVVIIPRKLKSYVPILFDLKRNGVEEVVYLPFAPEDINLSKKLSSFSIKGLKVRFSDDINEILSASAVISERFHGSLVSAFYGKPFISVNDEKFRRFFSRYDDRDYYAKDLFQASLKLKKLNVPQVRADMIKDCKDMYEKFEKLLLNVIR